MIPPLTTSGNCDVQVFRFTAPSPILAYLEREAVLAENALHDITAHAIRSVVRTLQQMLDFQEAGTESNVVWVEKETP